MSKITHEILNNANHFSSNTLKKTWSHQQDMDYFKLNLQFENYNSFLNLKGQYERETNNILFIYDSHKLKGQSDFVSQTVYERLIFECKAGPERPSKSKGIRKSSTYKRGCPFKVRIALENNKLTVKEVHLVHENHLSDENTYQHYPENMRLTENEIAEAEKMLACGGKKKLIKNELMKNRTNPLAVKALHNLQAKKRTERQQLSRDNELEKLITSMNQVPNAIVHVVKNDDNELIGVYFQDQRMVDFFEKFPEVLFFDATHNVNSRKMPLFIQSIIDGNGQTEIVSLYLCKSESRESVGAMIDIFQQFNPAWERTRVIIGDKDFADRAIYTDKFLHAVLQICLFHVCKTFNREINTLKRNITKDQRTQCLEIIQKIVYSQTAEEYEKQHRLLLSLKLPEVTSYFNNNWHTIRDEWTLHGKNKHANYLNATNNRLESLNSKIKMLGSRHDNLLTFFENLSVSVSIITSEKDIKTVRNDMKVQRVRFTDPLDKYYAFLTPFIFEKVKQEYEAKHLVKFSSIDQEQAVVNSKGLHSVSAHQCSCFFYSTMTLPCKHIFMFLSSNKMELFTPELCARRWTKKYYTDSHPVLNASVNTASIKPTYITTVRIPEEKDRYKKTAKLTSEINSIAASMSSGQYTYFYEKVQFIRNEMIHGSTTAAETTGNGDVVATNVLPAAFSTLPVLSNEQREFLSTFLNSALQTVGQSGRNNIPIVDDSEAATESINPVVETSQPEQKNPSSLQRCKIENIRSISIPDKINSVGRPKGSKTTVIGVKRKITNLQSTMDFKRRYIQKSDDDQALTVLEWLTKKDRSEIMKMKLHVSDIIHDPMIFSRVKNPEVNLQFFKNFVNQECYEFIAKLKKSKSPWLCGTCNKTLSGSQVLCEKCLDWHHYKCVGFRNSKENPFFCVHC